MFINTKYKMNNTEVSCEELFNMFKKTAGTIVCHYHSNTCSFKKFNCKITEQNKKFVLNQPKEIVKHKLEFFSDKVIDMDGSYGPYVTTKKVTQGFAISPV